MRDIEVENGGSAPRIHSMDDYFMTEVDKVLKTFFKELNFHPWPSEDSNICVALSLYKVEESDSASSNSGRSKRPIVKKVMEYCYEPEMEEVSWDKWKMTINHDRYFSFAKFLGTLEFSGVSFKHAESF